MDIKEVAQFFVDAREQFAIRLVSEQEVVRTQVMQTWCSELVVLVTRLGFTREDIIYFLQTSKVRGTKFMVAAAIEVLKRF